METFIIKDYKQHCIQWQLEIDARSRKSLLFDLFKANDKIEYIHKSCTTYKYRYLNLFEE